MDNKEKEPKRILVLGDWFVDENWIVTKENSEYSSHIGKQLYKSKIADVKSQLLSLCGAGSIARLLHSLSTAENNIEIYGLGFWEPEDTKFLAALFRSDCNIYNQTPHSLKGMFKIELKNEKDETNPLCRQTEGDCFNCAKAGGIIGEQCLRLQSLSSKGDGTYRVIRVYSQSYSHTGLKYSQLLDRYDWDYIQPPKFDPKKLEIALNKWKDELKGKSFDIIVVADHKKGGISIELVDNLFESGLINDSNWYVRTKDPNNEWILGIRDKLKLLVLGPNYLDNETGPWFLGQHLSLEAIDWLCKKKGIEINSLKGKKQKEYDKYISRIENIKKFAVVTLHDNNKMAGIFPSLLCNTDSINKVFEINDSAYILKDNLIFTTKKCPSEPTFKNGRTSAMFSSLIASFERLFNNETKLRLKIDSEDIEKALNLSYQWCIDSENNINQGPYKKMTNINFRNNYKTALNITPPNYFEIHISFLKYEIDAWFQSLNIKNCGIVDISCQRIGNSILTPPNKFQIWRGWSPIKGYISLSTKNKRAILKLMNATKAFSNEIFPNSSLSCMIVGSPGWGKSFLVESLAKYLNIDYIEFNVTQLANIDDLIACFDTISSVQTRNHNKPILVFWDEINALLESQNVYSQFLGPMWNGIYRRKGQTFQLKPCIWIFAGTRYPDEPYDISENESSKRIEILTKGSDFRSRINGPIIHLHDKIDPGSVDKISKMEQAYMFMSIVNRRFPDVTLVTELVLQFFQRVTPKYGARSMEFILSQFKNINNDTLNSSNFPTLDEIENWIDNYNEIKEFFDELITMENIDDNYKARIYAIPPNY